MAWTTPTDRTTGYTVTAADWNIVEDDLSFLYGDSTWTAVSGFTNSWVATGSAPYYILIGRVVYLRGAIGSGTANTAAFTLPAAYRPTQGQQFTCAQNSSSTPINVAVNTSGTVVPLTSATVWLSNITYPVV